MRVNDDDEEDSRFELDVTATLARGSVRFACVEIDRPSCAAGKPSRHSLRRAAMVHSQHHRELQQDRRLREFNINKPQQRMPVVALASQHPLRPPPPVHVHGRSLLATIDVASARTSSPGRIAARLHCAPKRRERLEDGDGDSIFVDLSRGGGSVSTVDLSYGGGRLAAPLPRHQQQRRRTTRRSGTDPLAVLLSTSTTAATAVVDLHDAGFASFGVPRAARAVETCDDATPLDTENDTVVAPPTEDEDEDGNAQLKWIVGAAWQAAVQAKLAADATAARARLEYKDDPDVRDTLLMLICLELAATSCSDVEQPRNEAGKQL